MNIRTLVRFVYVHHKWSIHQLREILSLESIDAMFRTGLGDGWTCSHHPYRPAPEGAE